MKQTILTVAFVLTMSAANYAQTNMQMESAEQSVITVVQQLRDAFMKSDIPFFEKYFADTFIFTDPGSKVHNKKEMIDFINGGDLKFESIVQNDRKVTVYENTAVVTLHTTEEGYVGKEDISGEYRWTYILNKQGGDWKIVAMHGTRVIKGG